MFNGNDEKVAASLKLNAARIPLTPINTPRLEVGWRANEISGNVGNGGDIRAYTIDEQHYTNCQLEPQIFVKKYFRLPGLVTSNTGASITYKENVVIFIATDAQNLVYNDNPPEHMFLAYEPRLLAYIKCAQNRYPDSTFVRTNDRGKRCGLATILSYLCYIDMEVQPEISGGSLGYDFASELASTSLINRKAARKLKNKAEKKCRRIIKVVNVATPRAGSRAYVYAAKDAGYETLLTFNKSKLLNKISNTKIDYLLKAFIEKPVQKKGNTIFDPVLDRFVPKAGNLWYFCKRK